MVVANRTSVCVLSQENLSWGLLNTGASVFNMANIAAAHGYGTYGSSFTHFRRAMAEMATRQHLPSLSPRLRQYGGASHASRRLLWRKIRITVAVLVLAAVHSGDNFLTSANFNARCNTAFFVSSCLRAFVLRFSFHSQG